MEVRYANRGLFFKKRRQIDLETIEDVKEHFSVANMEGVIVEKDGKEILMIFGSNELIDWFYNFSFRFMTTPYPSVTRDEIKVHKGFYTSYLRIRDFILKRFKNNENLIVYGQSLGGAIATLAALDLKYNYRNLNIELITTGSPKVGNNEFARSFNKYIGNYVRYVYGRDIVVIAPPGLFGYVHVVEETTLGKKKKIRMSVKDHMVEAYLKGYLDHLT